MKPSKRPRPVTGLLAAAALCLGATAVHGQPVTVLSAVGPDSGPRVPVTGYLVVYTETENPINVGDLVYYPHTAYRIYDSHGALFKSVRNHLSERDEQPTRVRLPQGHYTVIGKSETRGQVAVPVVINGLRTTVVNLEKRSHAG